MISKGVFWCLLLLLSCGTSFGFSNENLYLSEQEISIDSFEYNEETGDLYQGTVPLFKSNFFQPCWLSGSRYLLLQGSIENRLQDDYFKRSKDIDIRLNVPTIIFPFHIFL